MSVVTLSLRRTGKHTRWMQGVFGNLQQFAQSVCHCFLLSHGFAVKPPNWSGIFCRVKGNGFTV